jgi:hypothetical protein
MVASDSGMPRQAISPGRSEPPQFAFSAPDTPQISDDLSRDEAVPNRRKFAAVCCIVIDAALPQ